MATGTWFRNLLAIFSPKPVVDVQSDDHDETSKVPAGAIRTSTREIWLTVLAAYQDEYADLAANFRDLDAKARATAAVAGVFAAATLAFARQIINGAPVEGTVAWLIVVAATLLGITVLCAVMAMRVVQVAVPPPAEEIKTIALDASGESDSLDEQDVADFYAEVMHLWSAQTTDIAKCNSSKARWLQGAQYTLMAAILLAVAATVVVACPATGARRETERVQTEERTETMPKVQETPAKEPGAILRDLSGGDSQTSHTEQNGQEEGQEKSGQKAVTPIEQKPK